MSSPGLKNYKTQSKDITDARIIFGSDGGQKYGNAIKNTTLIRAFDASGAMPVGIVMLAAFV